MGRPALLEGEVVQRVLRPHPLGRLPSYGPGLALLGAAGLWALLSGLAPGLGAGLDAGTGFLAVPLLLLLWWATLAAALGPFALRLRSPWPMAYGVALAAAGGFGVVLAGMPAPSAAGASGLLPWLAAGGALPLLGLAEARRRGEGWTVTNLRLARRAGKAAEESLRWTRVERLHIERRGPRAADFGDLVVVAKGSEVRIPGVRPLVGLRDELELMLQTAPEAAYLGQQRDVAEKVGRLLRPGGGAGR